MFEHFQWVSTDYTQKTQTQYIQKYLKWITDLKELKTIKFLEENLGGNLQDLRLSKDFLRQGTISINHVRIIDKLNFT